MKIFFSNYLHEDEKVIKNNNFALCCHLVSLLSKNFAHWDFGGGEFSETQMDSRKKVNLVAGVWAKRNTTVTTTCTWNIKGSSYFRRGRSIRHLLWFFSFWAKSTYFIFFHVVVYLYRERRILYNGRNENKTKSGPKQRYHYHIIFQSTNG